MRKPIVRTDRQKSGVSSTQHKEYYHVFSEVVILGCIRIA
jgi:hypothetical protein